MYMLHTNWLLASVQSLMCASPFSVLLMIRHNKLSIEPSSLVIHDFLTKIWFMVGIVTYEVPQNMSHDG